MFRAAIGGFNKADVLNYIDELTNAWNEERTQLEKQARIDREQATKSEAVATQAQEAYNAMAAELQAAREAMASMQPLAEQTKGLSAKVEQLYEELNEAIAQNNRLKQALAQSEEKSQSARAEMMAAEDRLQTRETELNRRNERLASLEAIVARYEAVLGQSDGMKQHLDDIVHPFTHIAARRAEDSIENTNTVIAALLAQLHELQKGLEEQKRALRQDKIESDAKYNRIVETWFAKAKELADTAVHRTTHFFR